MVDLRVSRGGPRVAEIGARVLGSRVTIEVASAGVMVENGEEPVSGSGRIGLDHERG